MLFISLEGYCLKFLGVCDFTADFAWIIYLDKIEVFIFHSRYCCPQKNVTPWYFYWLVSSGLCREEKKWLALSLLISAAVIAIFHYESPPVGFYMPCWMRIWVIPGQIWYIRPLMITITMIASWILEMMIQCGCSARMVWICWQLSYLHYALVAIFASRCSQRVHVRGLCELARVLVDL